MGSGKTFGSLVKGLLHLGVKKKEVGGGGDLTQMWGGNFRLHFYDIKG